MPSEYVSLQVGSERIARWRGEAAARGMALYSLAIEAVEEWLVAHPAPAHPLHTEEEVAAAKNELADFFRGKGLL